MITPEERFKLRSNVLKASIQYYIVSHNEKTWINKRGETKRKRMSKKDFAKRIGASLLTVYKWEKTGRISRVYERELIRLGILRERLP